MEAAVETPAAVDSLTGVAIGPERAIACVLAWYLAFVFASVAERRWKTCSGDSRHRSTAM